MRSFSLNGKMVCVFAILIIGSGSIAWVGTTKMNVIKDSLDHIVGVLTQRVFAAEKLQGTIRQIQINEKNLVLEKDKTAMTGYSKEIEGLSGKFLEQLQNATKIASVEGNAKLQDIAREFKTFSDIDHKIQEDSLTGKEADAFELSTKEGKEARNAIEKDVQNLIDHDQKEMDEESVQADGVYKAARDAMIWVSLAAILIGLTVAFVILRGVSKAIGQVIAQLNDNSAQVTTAAQQIASASEELSQATTEQAASLEETSSAVEQMSSMIKRNADGATKSAELSQVSSDSATRGKEVVDDMMKAMAAINDSNSNIMHQINESNNKIAEIVKVIAEIGNKTKVINEIVFQTKLLSFNASVEAARAGEHGKGFAVVAEEVGNLAQMSGNAAKDISEMLDGSIQKVEGIVAETKERVERLVAEGKTKVEAGTRVAEECGRVLDEIVGNVGGVTTMVGDISTASNEQAKGIEEITRAMTQLDQVTQQNASVSEQAASSAEELSAQAVTLGQTVQVLINTIKGGAGEGVSGLDKARAAGGRPSSLTSAGPQVGHGKVIHLKSGRTSRPQPSVRGENSMKQVVGSDIVPSEDDPRFKEV